MAFRVPGGRGIPFTERAVVRVRAGRHAALAHRRGRSGRRRHYSSLSMVIGSERMRRPVAWYTALAMAAGTPTMPISPRPLTPTGLDLSGSPTKITSRSRSEEHTSELQSHLNLVCRLLLEKKK